MGADDVAPVPPPPVTVPDAPARQGDYRQARIGAATALILASVFLAVVDPLLPDYEVSPVVLLILLSAGLSLLSVDALGILASLTGGRK